MSQSSKNQMDNYELRPRNNPNHTECSRAGEMSLFPVVEPATRELVPPATQVPATQVTRGSIQSTTPTAAERAEAAYQDIMTSLPTFLKKSLPSQITIDQLDSFSTYVSIPFDKTLKDEAKSLQTCTEVDIRAVDKLRAALPQETENTHRLPWYTFVDEAMLVLSGLVYDKEFDPEAKDDPSTWDELMIIASASQMEEVDFDAMLGERPYFFDHVKIKSNTKPRESMVPSDFAPAAPLPLSAIPVPQVRPILKRITNDIPTSTSNSSKRAKKVVPFKRSSKIMPRDSRE
ncbi:hypothetical protein LIER_32025 [Lithospermum erythrorhizon]|uniref:Uncharacterized protein n=1 Tax=Lithospermum erythrorhizon TaxID=34254 RepID=A0AAV3RWJ4_LITER